MKARKKLVVLKENSGAGKSTFYLPRLAVQYNHQSEVAVHFIIVKCACRLCCTVDLITHHVYGNTNNKSSNNEQESEGLTHKSAPTQLPTTDFQTSEVSISFLIFLVLKLSA